ncbi:MAG: methyltransferase domain-containing protein [Flavobacterium sp.]|nr:methyltransferase domain-containing protein [Flavobacterium sp.]
MDQFIIHPDSSSKLASKTDHHFLFEDGSQLPVFNGTPILFGSESIFTAEDVLQSKTTTQDAEHLDNANFKNYIRRKLLPQLCTDFRIEKRYKELSDLLSPGSKVLIIGAGEKITYYRDTFPNAEVITSDVHNQFRPDYVFDGHFIPFAAETFDMVLAAQVIEHTINPWLFCTELQRITKIGGLLQIEAPQTFPYHAEPYDFFRFTFTGMRSLFPECDVVKSEITEGSAAAVAVMISNYWINIATLKPIRHFMLLISRLLLGWMKYLDGRNIAVNKRTVAMPKGYAFTFKKDGIRRKSAALLEVFYGLKH